MKQIFYLIVLPIFILIVNNLVSKEKPKTFVSYLDILLRSLPHLYGYMLLLYYLGMENIADTGWAPITMITVLVPISIIALLLKFFFWLYLRIISKDCFGKNTS